MCVVFSSFTHVVDTVSEMLVYADGLTVLLKEMELPVVSAVVLFEISELSANVMSVDETSVDVFVVEVVETLPTADEAVLESDTSSDEDPVVSTFSFFVVDSLSVVEWLSEVSSANVVDSVETVDAKLDVSSMTVEGLDIVPKEDFVVRDRVEDVCETAGFKPFCRQGNVS